MSFSGGFFFHEQCLFGFQISPRLILISRSRSDDAYVFYLACDGSIEGPTRQQG